MRVFRQFVTLVAVALSLLLVGCGGGGGQATPNPSPSTGGNPGATLPMVISTPAVLPTTVTNANYSTTLKVVNNVGAVKWSIKPSTAMVNFVDGLTINADTGVLSGAANWGGTAAFLATVTDSANRSVSKDFFLSANPPLAAGSPFAETVRQYSTMSTNVTAFGGVFPHKFSLVGGNLPPGLALNSAGLLYGSPTAMGDYVATVRVIDSFSPPASVDKTISIKVTAPYLQVMQSLPRAIRLNQPFSGKIVVRGGVPPYKMDLPAFTLPPGLTFDSASRTIQGTPTAAGDYFFSTTVTDSSTPTQNSYAQFQLKISSALGRNDSIQTATTVTEGGYGFSASLSPFDSDPSATTPSDHDYYKLNLVAGSIVRIRTGAMQYDSRNPTDTVIEVLDANGTRLQFCRQPDGPTGVYSATCLNDDIGGSPYVLDSELELKAQGASGEKRDYYIHVFDWTGMSRPDYVYGLNLVPVFSPLQIQSTKLAPAALNREYKGPQLFAENGVGTKVWSVSAGSLPAGLTLNSTGSISGAATSLGTSNVTIKVQDSSVPPQTFERNFSMQVVEPAKYTSSATLPDACLNKPYSFTPQFTGGVAPFFHGFYSDRWPYFFHYDNTTGSISGTPEVNSVFDPIGTYMANWSVFDETGYGDGQSITVRVINCP